MSIYIGDFVTANGTFDDIDGNPIDPSDVVLRITDPDGLTTIYTDNDIVKDSTGRYHLYFTVDVDGVWCWRWEGVGAAVGVDEGRWYVRPTDHDLT